MPPCGCTPGFTWSGSACVAGDGEGEDDDSTQGNVESTSANVMKFFVSALVALIALL